MKSKYKLSSLASRQPISNVNESNKIHKQKLFISFEMASIWTKIELKLNENLQETEATLTMAMA
jgi:hypothetical protein